MHGRRDQGSLHAAGRLLVDGEPRRSAGAEPADEVGGPMEAEVAQVAADERPGAPTAAAARLGHRRRPEEKAARPPPTVLPEPEPSELVE